MSELPALVPPVRLPVPPPAPEFPGLPTPGRRGPERAPVPRRKAVRPRYTQRFHCIAAACEDTCCKGWSVPVDQGTYEKYRSHEVLKPFVGTLITLNTNQPTTSNYARMPLNGAGTCAFQEPDKLCGIQKHFGAEMLSVTCATYPRAAVTMSGEAEEALNLSCPEAARVVLLEPDLLGMGWKATGRQRYAGVEAMRRQTLRREETRLAVREFVLLLLGDRGYPVWQRLYLLGPLVRRLQVLSGEQPVAGWCEANAVAVTHLLADTAGTAASGRLREVMNGMVTPPAEQLQLVLELLRLRTREAPPIPDRFVECLQAFEQGIGSKDGQSEEAILEAYQRGYELYYRPLMERHPHLIENYLFNHVFKNLFPFGRKSGATTSPASDRANAEDEYLLLCVQAAMVQTLLCGMAAHYREEFGVEHVVKLVQSLAKAVEHSVELQTTIIAFVRERGLDQPQGVALLLRQGYTGVGRLQ